MPAAWVSAGAAALGAYSSLKNGKSSTSSSSQQLDPRAQDMLYGSGGNAGLLSKYQGFLDKPQNPGASNYGTALDDYLARNSGTDINTIAGVGNRLAAGGGVQAHTGSASVVNGLDPAQGRPAANSLDLTGSYSKFINGNPAENPYLTGAIGKGINQSKNAFDAMQQGATDNLQKNILPGIRSGAIGAGQYGGSRQGIAEGNAIGDFQKAQQQAISQFGQNNTDAAVAAQSQNFSSGQDRALAATQGLSAQQQQAYMQQQALEAARNSQNSAQQQQVFNKNTETFNNTDAINAQAQLTGAGLLSNLGNGAYQTSNNMGQYGLNQAGQVNGLLSPYLSLGGTSTQTSPLYSNTWGNAAGGAAAGLGIYNQFRNAYNTTSTPNAQNVAPSTPYDD